MPNPQHQKAQELATLASLEMQEGDVAIARQLYAEAAALEEQAFDQIPDNKSRTRGILGVSLGSLLYKARKFDAAEVVLHRLLGLTELTTAARQQLRELLEVVWDEKTLLETGYEYAMDELSIALRGGTVGSGTAPLELVVQKADGFKSLLYRVAEWTGQHPFRKRGRPPSEIFQALQFRATQPTGGSYRFTLRFVEPAQRDLFALQAEPRVHSAAVAESTTRILKLLNTGAIRELHEYVPQEDYRRAFTQLVRNLAPTRKDAREIEVRRRSGRPDEMEESVVLVMGSRAAINEVVKASLQEDFDVTEIRGVLRALDLDREWVDIQTDAKKKRCQTPPEFLDDVVGPMVNRRVVAHGKTKGGKFLLRDIELDEEGDA